VRVLRTRALILYHASAQLGVCWLLLA
jgi:hypothetical protein